MQALQQLAPDLRVLTLQHLLLQDRLSLPPSLAGSWLAHAHPFVLDLSDQQLPPRPMRALLQLLRCSPKLHTLKLNCYAVESRRTQYEAEIAEHSAAHARVGVDTHERWALPVCPDCQADLIDGRQTSVCGTADSTLFLLDLVQGCAALPQLRMLELRQLCATAHLAALAPRLVFTLQHVRWLSLRELSGTPCKAAALLREFAALPSLEELELRDALRWRSDRTLEPWMLQPFARAPALQRIVVSEGACPAGPPKGLAGRLVCGKL